MEHGTGDTTDGRLVTLTKGATLRIEHASGAWVRCASGAVWVTQEGDLRDLVLEAGERVALDRDGLAVLQALEPTRLAIGRSRRAAQPSPTPAAEPRGAAVRVQRIA